MEPLNLIGVRTEFGKSISIHRPSQFGGTIKAAIGNASELQGIATWKPSQAMRFDQDAFRQANPELHTQYQKQNSERQFRLVRK